MPLNHPQNINLITHGQFPEQMIEQVSAEISKRLILPVQIIENHTDLEPFFDPHRNQYDANKLLAEVHKLKHENAVKTIGLFRVDLYIPILTYIFGQAFLGGDTGIASMYRLRNELYGLRKKEKLLIQRTSKVVIHELGHAFSLIHCHTPECVMISSTYVEDLDQKTSQFCDHCKEKINFAILDK